MTSRDGDLSAAEPLLSVVSPVYNGESFITESVRDIIVALESLERPFEVIVVCDGTDDTVKRARSVPDDRVRVLDYRHNEAAGYGMASRRAANDA